MAAPPSLLAGCTCQRVDAASGGSAALAVTRCSGTQALAVRPPALCRQLRGPPLRGRPAPAIPLARAPACAAIVGGWFGRIGSAVAGVHYRFGRCDGSVVALSYSDEYGQCRRPRQLVVALQALEFGARGNAARAPYSHGGDGSLLS